MPRLLGFVVEIEGKAFLEKDDSKAKDYLISIGTRIFHGDIISVERDEGKEARLVLFDMSSKNRLVIPEGRYQLKATKRENNRNMFSQILKKYQELTGSNSISTGVSTPR